ncbi:MAG: hypothetical protein PHP95_10695 [Desulfuromonadaceae bacterium]|nr:hypothetical protein [Desulfuromonadaceae bacterium]MDD2848914.1 hypothetical protein [Desulfuromonadaceae bacterium]MDD4132129.1 hypothetical protein [Desulfuromonadaceae bacterium]
MGSKGMGGTIKLILIVATGLWLMAGCSVNDKFVYMPTAPVGGVQKLPVKIAVLPFKDGTENFTTRGNLFIGMTHNLAKGGINIQITALTPELWAKAFANDMAASGAFRTVRFIYSPSELSDEDYYIDGTLRKAYFFTDGSLPNEFALGLRTVQRVGNKLVWEKEVTKEWKLPNDIFEGCGLGQQCKNDRLHAEINRVMQGLFEEVRTDLVRSLEVQSRNRAGEVGIAPTAFPLPLDSESVDAEIKKVLNGK